jgi:MATE family multidrug resistance protein
MEQLMKIEECGNASVADHSTDSVTDEQPEVISEEPIISEQATDALTTNREVLQALARFSLPLVGSRLLLMANLFASALILAAIDEDNLAAAGIIEPIQGILISAMVYALGAVYLHASEPDAKQHYKTAGIYLRQGWVYSLLVGFGLLPFTLNTGPILKMMGQSDTIASISQEYFNGLSIGITPVFGLFANNSFFNALKRPNATLVTSIFTVAITLGFGYSLTLGKWGAPKLGAFGLGLANSISAWSCFLGSTAYLAISKNFKRYRIFSTHCGDKLSHLWALIKTGTPLAITNLVDLISAMSTMFLTGYVDERYLIPQGTVTQYILLSLTQVFAISEATAIIVKRQRAIGNTAVIKKVPNMGVVLGGVTSSLWLTAFATMPKPMLSLFRDDIEPDLVSLFGQIGLINAIGMLVGDTARLIYTSAEASVDDLKASTKINASSLLGVGVSLAVAATLVMGLDPVETVLAINLIRYASIALGAALINRRWTIESTEIQGGITQACDYSFSSFFWGAHHSNKLEEEEKGQSRAADSETPLLIINDHKP